MSLIDPFQLATNGVGPGFTTFNVATSGFGFDIEVIVRPVGGGGGGAVIWSPAGPYEIIVRVRYKDKKWEEHRVVSSLAGKSLEKVLASFKFVQTKSIQVRAAINNIIQKSVQVIVRGKPL